VRERGEGEVEGRYKEFGGPSTLLRYVPTAYFLLPLAKLLPLTNRPKKTKNGRAKDGRTKDTTYIFSSTLATDGQGSD
jgi:hypothetical protein